MKTCIKTNNGDNVLYQLIQEGYNGVTQCVYFDNGRHVTLANRMFPNVIITYVTDNLKDTLDLEKWLVNLGYDINEN